ncbi:hypothetical protein [Methylobacterium sp. SyP6R]|uniref:hypothetical protein n=1 Tax=Methylobacterium sp. SyP6R TaxID=2718876 RepID=UPI001F1F2AD2|nr:hypothetical protein [Methylobacterium sp. SyP6R]MCF4123962.1 hypothetical protein [Methylobacterium sp. SyP6R]
MDTHEQRLEAMHPLLEDGAEAPGRSIPSTSIPGADQWVGEFHWRTRRGPAFVLWSFGRPDGALNARYPDGSRGMIVNTLDHGPRRRASGPRRWTYGTMDIEENDVAFHDGVQPVYAPPAPDPFDLEAVLARDPGFLAALADDRFAQAIYAVFQNRTFIETRSGRTWMCGDRQAAHLVANLRGLGESYHDYFLTEFEGTWPDDEAARVTSLQGMMSLLGGSLPIPDIKPAARPVLNPDGSREAIRDEAHAGVADSDWRGQAEQQWQAAKDMRDSFASSARAALAEIERQPNRDVYEVLRGHLARLGWRTENDEDRDRARAAAREDGLEVLQAVKQREGRPAGECPSWAQPILDRRERQTAGNGFRLVATAVLAGLGEDEREVELGRVQRRLDDLAITGRLDEEEYADLSGRLSSSALDR